ncbi:MAG: hypothetical protein JWQ31_2357 [Mycobacterium sp.]|nr:hypothetical protein [Mycobacterium sp.]
MRMKGGAPDSASKSQPTYSRSVHPDSRSMSETTRFGIH